MEKKKKNDGDKKKGRNVGKGKKVPNEWRRGHGNVDLAPSLSIGDLLRTCLVLLVRLNSFI